MLIKLSKSWSTFNILLKDAFKGLVTVWRIQLKPHYCVSQTWSSGLIWLLYFFWEMRCLDLAWLLCHVSYTSSSSFTRFSWDILCVGAELAACFNLLGWLTLLTLLLLHNNGHYWLKHWQWSSTKCHKIVSKLSEIGYDSMNVSDM